MTAPLAGGAAIPELGPLLGRLTDTEPLAGRRGGVPLDDVRYGFVTSLFELSGAAREFAEAGDIDAAASSLGRYEWLAAWERAVAAVAERVVARLDARIEAAALESRLPVRRLAQLRPDDEERRAIAVRLGVSGGPFVAALDSLERTVPGAGRNPAGVAEWQAALGLVARRLEVSWTALQEAADAEEAAWRGEIERVRAWRRPRWPLWLISAVVAALAVYLGLVLGGFVVVPPVLAPVARFSWGYF